MLQYADIYLAIPLQQGQISCRELMRGEVILKAIPKDQPIMIDAIDSPYANIPSLTELIYSRGLAPQTAARAAKAGGGK
jgi:N-acetylneuraminate synthase